MSLAASTAGVRPIISSPESLISLSPLSGAPPPKFRVEIKRPVELDAENVESGEVEEQKCVVFSPLRNTEEVVSAVLEIIEISLEFIATTSEPGVGIPQLAKKKNKASAE